MAMKKNDYIDVIKYRGLEKSPLLDTVVKAINDYLLHNQGNASDFHLLKNIVDRHVDTVDDEINQLLPVPLYCGLVATMIGIIFGLFGLSDDVTSDSFVTSIAILLRSIKWAMILSVFGLLCTTVLTVFFYRPAKLRLEQQKNVFYNFIQKKLLPHLNEDAVSTIVNMQNNLREFNTSFGNNVSSFSHIMDEIRSTFDSQVRLLHQLERMDMQQMARFNGNVLAQLQSCMSEFESFTRYLRQMNTFVDQTTRLTDSVNRQLDRTHAVESVFQDVKDNVDRNREVMEMLSNFLVRVNEQEALLAAAGQFDEAVRDQLNTFKRAINHQIDEMTTHTTKASADLDALMGRERANLDKLKELNNLSKLITAIEGMEKHNQAVNSQLASRIEQLTRAINAKNQRAENGGFPLSSTMTKVIFGFVGAAALCYIISLLSSAISSLI